jgi:hypothetical protein
VETKNYNSAEFLAGTDLPLEQIALAVHFDIGKVPYLLETGDFDETLFDSLEEAIEDELETEIPIKFDGPLYGYGLGFEYDGAEYAVLSEDDADAAWDEALDCYLEDCVLCELPETARNYFDEEKWKRDTRINNGRGRSLNSYDGGEDEVTLDVGGKVEWFCVYRTN